MPQARKSSKTVKPLLAIRPAAQGGTVEVLIYGDIGESWFAETVDAKSFAEKIAAVKADELLVRINSYGGSVTDGIAIFNAIKQHPAPTKTVQVDGVAVSSASLIAMAGDTLRMFENSLLMIHAPWTMTVGNAVELRENAVTLDTFAAAMATSYASKSGQTREAMLTLLTDGVDHWYTADEAQAAGFCDEVSTAAPPDAATSIAPDPAAPAAPGLDDPATNNRGIERFAARAPLPIAAALRGDREHAMPPVVHSLRDLAQFEAAQAISDRARARFDSAATAAPTHEEAVMTHETTAAAPADTKAAVVAAHAALRERNEQIVAALRPYQHFDAVREYQIEALADPEQTIEQVRTRTLELIGRHAEPANGGGGRVEAGEDARDKFRAGAQLAIEIRAGLAKNDGANPLRGYTLAELARMSLDHAGKRSAGLSRMEVVGLGFTSTSDFPAILSNVAEKAVLKGWTEAPETFQQWTSVGELSDFKPAKRVDLNVFPALAEVPDGGEYKYGFVGDRGETVQLATYGRMFAITRQAVINDDIGAFTRLPLKMGRAAKRTVGNLAYAVLTSNPAMADGVTLFHANHKNLVTGTVISTANVDALRVLMAKQSDPQSNAAALNIPLGFLLVPVALGGLARQVANSVFEVGNSASTKANTAPNYVRGLFQVIDDARLDLSSTTAWYGCADPAMFDTVEVSYLNGQQQPYLEQKDGWDMDGTEFKVRIDAGVKALDYRTFAKNPGA